MTYDEFKASLAFGDPPPGLSPVLRGLWHLEKGDWHRSHEIIQTEATQDAAWAHAHLHRVEGDLWNADYWYARAGRERPEASLDAERADMIDALLKSGGTAAAR